MQEPSLATCSEEAKAGFSFHFLEDGHQVVPFLNHFGIDMLPPPEPVAWTHCESSEDELEAADTRRGDDQRPIHTKPPTAADGCNWVLT